MHAGRQAEIPANDILSADILSAKSYTVAELATLITSAGLGAGDAGAGVYCSNAVWSGGTGCQVRWDGAAWRDPDQNIAASNIQLSIEQRKSLRDSYVAIPSQAFSDGGMTGLYDRNELSNAAFRGTVTVSITGAGIFTNTKAILNQLFDSRAGTFLSISGTDATTTQIQIHVDMLANLPNYSDAKWQPFIQFRGGTGPGFLFTFYENILVEVSQDNVTWFTAASNGWQGTNIGSANTLYPDGFWFGSNAQPTVPSAIITFRYIRFTLTNRVENAAYGNKAFVWISQIGLRHLLAEYTREYVSVMGDELLGNVLYRRGATAQLGTADNFDLQLIRNGSVIAILTNAGLDALKLFYAGQDTDSRYVLATALAELIDDEVASLLQPGANISLSYNDAGNALTIAVTGLTSANVSNFTEAVEDVIGAFATDSTFIDPIYDDLTNTIIWTLIDGSITYTKLANIASGTLLGRSSAGAGSPEQITIGAGLSLSAGVLSNPSGASSGLSSPQVMSRAAWRF